MNYEQKYLKYKNKYLALKKNLQLGSGTSPSTLIQLGISSVPPVDPNFYNVAAAYNAVSASLVGRLASKYIILLFFYRIKIIIRPL
jgi:hypothetical protein